ncbi:MAG TPA: tRNA (N(6)-L-threonylcarbamoyladenosine(37)-C(2))-methylthiotransferase MtaB [Dehalococcoidia bacterium]|nr:tRNA (N(6)-L-threonylcarbamoyladenosine(37)-C(2))-methylthiotransferase MtaB [Dehalococcoidia bacterium]
MADRGPTVALLTLGCKLNQADSQAIARRLAGEGVRVVDRPLAGADATVINTCSVTHVADRKARHLVRMARRLSPGAPVVLTGCYAETAPADAPALAEANLVLKNGDKPSIPDWLLERLRERGDPAAGCPTPVRDGLRRDGRPSGRTRAFVKIQEGCDELCAFCIVPYTRGREASVPVERVVEEVRAREAEGVREVVLTGTQLGNYGRDLGPGGPPSGGWRERGPRRLLAALLERTSVARIRLSSLQAQDISPELLRLWRDARLCPHFHLPLQSGADDVLGRMRRRYTADEFRRAVALIREHVPDVAITTDVIAGFPGETDADFEATCRLVEEVEFAAVHAFPYSRRPGTGAALMSGQLAAPLKRSRLERLLTLGRASAGAFRRRFLGRTLDVLWEQESDNRWQGLTPNYIRVYTCADADLANRLLATRLVGLADDGVSGVLEPAAVASR